MYVPSDAKLLPFLFVRYTCTYMYFQVLNIFNCTEYKEIIVNKLKFLYCVSFHIKTILEERENLQLKWTLNVVF